MYHIEKLIEPCMSVCMCAHVQHILRCNVFVLMHNTCICNVSVSVCTIHNMCPKVYTHVPMHTRVTFSQLK